MSAYFKPFPLSGQAPETGQMYDNPFGLVLVPHVTDLNGQPRAPLNMLLTYLVNQEVAPPGFVPWNPEGYPLDKWLYYVPERCYLPRLYQLNTLLRYLKDLGVSDSKHLQVLVYATDYGRLACPVMRYISYQRTHLFEHTTCSPEDQDEALARIFEYIKDYWGFHYTWHPKLVARDKARQADEEASCTLVQRELINNIKGLTIIVHAKDRNGQRRLSMKKIVHCLTNNHIPPGFTHNHLFTVSQDLEWWLRYIPEYALVHAAYNLKQLYEWLASIPNLSVPDIISLIYASDWGYTDNFVYKRVRLAVVSEWVTYKRAFIFKSLYDLPPTEIAAGGREARKAVRDYIVQNTKKTAP